MASVFIPAARVVELKVRLYNRTPFVQTFLWWANVAARVHEKYQSFFRPMFATWPIMPSGDHPLPAERAPLLRRELP